MHIFLAEQELSLRRQITRWLKKEGHTVDALENGDMALQFILSNPHTHDLILLDSVLPIKSGKEVCAHIREAHIQTPILMLVDSKEIQNQNEIVSLDAVDYLVKPFSSHELILRVLSLAARSTTLVPIVLTVGKASLDVRDRCLTKGGDSVDLTPKEVSLLEYFMARPNKIIGRRELFTAVWGEDSVFASNVVDAHIKNVRKKISKVGAEEGAFRIETVRRLGYRLVGIP